MGTCVCVTHVASGDVKFPEFTDLHLPLLAGQMLKNCNLLSSHYLKC